MKRLFAMILILILCLSVAACGTTPAAEPEPATPAPADTPADTPADEPQGVDPKSISVCFVCEALGDNSFNDRSHNSNLASAEKYGIEYHCTQTGAGGDTLVAVREAAQNGYDIVTSFYSAELRAMLEEEAPDYPDTLFFMFTAPMDYEPPCDNIVACYYRNCEAAYLGGVVAGSESKSGLVSFIGGQELINIHDWQCGYLEGVEAGGANTVYAFIGGDNPFNDPAKAKEIAYSLYNNYGVDIQFCCASQSGDGMFECIKELREAKGTKDFWAIGVDSDQYTVFAANDKMDTAEVILTSCMKNPMAPMNGFIETLLAGEKIPGGHLTRGIKDDACGIAENDFFKANASEKTLKLIEQQKEAIKNDEIVVSTSYGLSAEDLAAFLAAHSYHP